MKPYQSFNWAEPETLNEMYKQAIIQRMKSKHGFLVDFLWLFLVMLPVPFICKYRFDLSNNEFIICVIGFTIWAFVLTCYGKIVEKKRVGKMQANEFVWRYGTVDRPTRDVKYRKPKSKIDGQDVSYIFNASEGDRVIVIGFNTTGYSNKRPEFYAVSI